METLIQAASKAHEKEYFQQQGNLGPFEGSIVEVVGRDDSLGVQYGPTQNRRMPIQHPFVGSNSWIRSVPDIGTRVLMQNRYDTGQAEIIKALPIAAFQRSTDYQNQQNTYRELSAGEHDIASAGYASLYMSRRGDIDMHSGSGVMRSSDKDRMEVRDSAPTVKQQYMRWTPGTMGDEARVGIVKRWLSPIDEYYVQDTQERFQAESYFNLRNPNQESPQTLVQRTEGHVYGSDGTLQLQFSTRNALRHQTFWYTNTDDFLRYEVDVNGNTVEIFPSLATIGKEIDIPNGSYRAQIGVDRDITITRDERVSVGQNIQYNVGVSVLYNVVQDFDIVAGQNAFTMSNDQGNETVGMVTAGPTNLMGFQASNSADGGTVSVFGPNNSGMFLTATQGALLQDGTGAGLTLNGADSSLFSQGGSIAQVGDQQINLALQTGTDTINISPGLLQIISSDGVAVAGNALNANVGNVFLGSNAAIPAVLGLTLMTYLDQHIHTATKEGAPTTPAIIPSSTFIGTPLSILSLAVFMSPNI